MRKTYLFYDLETTGSNPCFDQALEFAGIRTDLELNELERYHFRVKLNSDIIPHPEALLVHRIPIQTMHEGLPEIEAVEQIHRLLNTPGTRSGGYNTLGFDDEFLRFSFHRNLLDPYTHQWKNECSRFDLYPIAQLYYLYHSDSLKWPVRPDGQISLKLENLSALNQLAQGNAHEAMTDVEATLNLARIFKKHNARAWDYALGFFDKSTSLERQARIHSFINIREKQYPTALLITGKAGSQHQFQYPALNLGQHLHYKNQSLWLRLDGCDFTTLTHRSAEDSGFWVTHTKPGEQAFFPLEERYQKQLDKERRLQTQANLEWLKTHPHILDALEQDYRAYKYPVIEHLDADADLYTAGFLSPDEQRLCVQFHSSSPTQKAALSQHFKNISLRNRAMRIMGRHYASHLTPKLTEDFQAYLKHLYATDSAEIPIDWKNKSKFVRAHCFTLLTELYKTRTENADIALLKGLEVYLGVEAGLSH